MSVCANTSSRRILKNITNMDDQEAEGIGERTGDNIEACIVDVYLANLPRGGDAFVRVNGEGRTSSPRLPQSADITATAAEADGVRAPRSRPLADQDDDASILSMAALPAARGDMSDPRCRRNEFNGTNCSKPFVRTCSKFESGSGSGDQDGIVSMEDGIDIATKKRKTRRGKPKHRKLKPYSKQHPGSYQQRLRCRPVSRPTKPPRQPPAPYNTTQFLIEDHNDLPNLEQQLAGPDGLEIPTVSFQKPVAPSRTRDSSFSVDSDENFFYSSPEDEEEFLTKEFDTVYDDLHMERLGSMSKTELLQEYVQLETKIELLTKRMKGKNLTFDDKDNTRCTPATISDMAKKLKIFQQRIDDLIRENEMLRRENDILKKQRHASPMSSIDSESDSDSGSFSNGNQSSCSCNHKSPGSSPVPASYQARRKKAQRKNSSVSSIDSESDSSSSNESSCSETSPKAAELKAATNLATPMDIPNGHEISNTTPP